MVLDTLPPHRHISSTPISLSAASSLLTTYLTNSESHPHLHPDALITPTGVTFSSHGGPMGGVVMHNLRRVAAGLRGEYLEPEATPEPEDEGWQDMAEYEREEGAVDVGEIGSRNTFVTSGGDAPEIHVTNGVDSEEVGQKRKKGDDEAKLDKAARKKAKKEKNKAFRREKENKKAKKTE